MMRTTVTVVVPTLGRSSLARALDSVSRQEHLPLEVVVVDDSPGRVATGGGAGTVPVRTRWTGGARGAAAARNLGMAEAQGDLVAFLDDDDVWEPAHLAAAVSLLNERPDVDVYASRALVRSTSSCRVEPTVVYADAGRSLLRFYYGRTTWARRRRRVMTPTLVFRRAVAALPMDETMSVREDTWWLLTAEQAGHRLWQSREATVVVDRDDAREAGRRELDDEFAWARRLDSLKPGIGVSYLIGTTGRLLARSGRRAELEELVDRLREYDVVPADLALVLQLERVSARVLPLWSAWRRGER